MKDQVYIHVSLPDGSKAKTLSVSTLESVVRAQREWEGRCGWMWGSIN